jgi:hypothetical protein
MAKAHDPLPCVNFVFDPPMRSMITKLIGIKINLINQNKINTKNNLVAININNVSTTQININYRLDNQTKDWTKGSPMRESKGRYVDLIIVDPA